MGPVVLDPRVRFIEARRCRAFVVVQLSGKIVEKHHVRTRAGDRRVIALRNEHGLTVAGGEQLVEVLLIGPVPLHHEAVVRLSSEVVHLFEIWRAVATVMAVRCPARPCSTRDIHLVQDEPFSLDWWSQHMVDVAVRSATTA